MEDGLHVSAMGVPARHSPELSILVPFYNSSGSVLTVLDRIESALNSVDFDYEIIAINDGSSDDTFERLKKAAKMDPRIALHTYERNMGKGYALRYGMKHSRGRFVAFIDGDLDILPDTIHDYVKSLHDCDLVIASKRHPLSKTRLPVLRRILSRSFNLLARMMTGVPLSDTQVGLKAGRGEILRGIFRILKVDRYAFDVEFLSVASGLGLRIKELPVELSNERQFKPAHVLRMFADLLSIAYRLRMKMDLELIDAHIKMSAKAERHQLVIAQVRDLLKASNLIPPPEIEKTVD